MQPQPGSWTAQPHNAPSHQAASWTASAPTPPQAPPAGPLPSAEVAGQMAQQAAVGFLSAMADFSFSSYVAPKLAKVLYVLVILGAIGVVVMGVGNGVSELFSSYGRVERALTSIVMAPFAGVGVLLLGRLYLEIMSVMFRIAELLGEINRKTR